MNTWDHPMERAEQLIGHLLDAGVVQAEDLRPCSDADISALETECDVQLPESYKVFLRRLGRSTGPLFENPDGNIFATYEAVREMTAVFREGFSDRVSLPDKWFCFAVLNKGDLFLFLPADGTNDDPPVYLWSDEWSDGGNLEVGYASFWDWFAELVQHEAERC